MGDVDGALARLKQTVVAAGALPAPATAAGLATLADPEISIRFISNDGTVPGDPHVMLQFSGTIVAPDGGPVLYQVEASPDLINWEPVYLCHAISLISFQ